MLSEFKSFHKTVGGNEGDKCLYNTRLDMYGCGCQHDCKYCYAKSLLSFRKLWNADEPRIAGIRKIEKVVRKMQKGTIVRLGGMSDCFQPLEEQQRVTLETIKLLNQYGIGYLIVTKSSLVAEREYLDVLDKDLAHVQITITCLDDDRAKAYENASPPSMRVNALTVLQDAGFDVALRISPFVEEYIDFPRFNSLSVNKCLIEFLRVNAHIKKWFPGVDYGKYTLRHSNYWHLPLQEKLRVLEKLDFPNVSICEDVSEHYEYWKNHFNPNSQDCCNLRQSGPYNQPTIFKEESKMTQPEGNTSFFEEQFAGQMASEAPQGFDPGFSPGFTQQPPAMVPAPHPGVVSPMLYSQPHGRENRQMAKAASYVRQHERHRTELAVDSMNYMAAVARWGDHLIEQVPSAAPAIMGIRDAHAITVAARVMRW